MDTKADASNSSPYEAPCWYNITKATKTLSKDQGILEGPAKCSGSMEQDKGNSQNMDQGDFTGGG